jgi:hypothetical protein
LDRCWLGPTTGLDTEPRRKKIPSLPLLVTGPGLLFLTLFNVVHVNQMRLNSLYLSAIGVCLCSTHLDSATRMQNNEKKLKTGFKDFTLFSNSKKKTLKIYQFGMSVAR